MSVAVPKWLTPWLVGAGLASVTLSLLLVIRAYAQLRRAEYYIIRESARRTVVRAALLTLILVLLTIGLLFVPRRGDIPGPTTMPPTATWQLTPVLTLPAATPTLVATDTPTPQPTATEPFIPTSTPMATLPVTFTVPLSLAVPPPADAQIEFWTLAQGADQNNHPVGATSQFPAGIERIYLFFRYDGLLNNIPWTTIWYKDGEYLSGGTDLWESQRPAGERYIFLGSLNGYAEGEYEVQVWLGDRLQIRAFFSVLKAEG
jgi:hypothetical protein